MPTLLTHAVVAGASKKLFFPNARGTRFLSLSVFCSVVPDFDGIGFLFGIPYSHVLGHRGFFHSLPFAGLLALAVATWGFRDTPVGSDLWWKLFFYFFALTASHGLLDAMTNGGLGIAFFAPFDPTRYFLPWRFLHVSPLTLTGLMTEFGARAILSELVWIWLPLGILTGIASLFRR